MTRMEMGSSEKDALPLPSPRGYIVQRLSQIGVPFTYLDLMQPGLVAFVLENPTMLPQIISMILPTDVDAFDIQMISRAGSDVESNNVGKDIFIESLLWLQWLMFRDEPQVALKKLAEKEIGQRAVCGAVWGQDDLAYRCRTCEHDPTCAICVQCFQNGRHKDHDYSIIYTSGGCCDCGDITAWKPEGFCSKHLGTQHIQPLSPEAAGSIEPVLDALLLCWKDKLLSLECNAGKHTTKDDHTNIHGQISNMFSSTVVEMLLDFCKCSESLLCFVSRKISQVAGLLDLLVKSEWFLSKTVVRKLHELLLKALGEPTFKYEFAKIFIQYYRYTIEKAVKKSEDSVIESHPLLSTFSVQIFTVPTLTARLVREENLLGILLQCLGELFYSCVDVDNHLQADKLYRTSLRLVGDIHFSLSHEEVSRYIANECPNIFKTWLRLMCLVQGMDPQRRVTGLHIEEENIHLSAPFVLGHHLERVHNLLVEGVFSATGEPDDQQRHAKMGKLSQESPFCYLSNREDEIGFSLQSAKFSVGCQIIPSNIKWLISECLQVIENCLGSKTKVDSSTLGCNLLDFPKKLFHGSSSKSGTMVYGRSFSSSPWVIDEHHVDVSMESSGILCPASWPEIVYDVSSQEISFHIPLHRFLTLLLYRAMKTYYSKIEASSSSGGVTSLPFPRHDFFSEVLGKYHCCGFSAFVLEAPLRLKVFCAQVRAGMWLRNGDVVTFWTDWYHAVHRFEALGDLFLLQCCASVEVDLFLLQCCAALAPPESFVTRIKERFGLSDYLSLNLGQFNEYEAVLMLEMLTLIIQIVKERRFCGMSPAEHLQREVIHKLAIGDATHSQLLRVLPDDLAKSKQMQEVVDKVASYKEPSSMKQGKYSLRNSHWKELDLYHPRWNARDLQIVVERYLQICKVSPLDVQLPQWTKIFSPLSAISRIATSKSVLQIVQAVLYYAVFAKKPSACRAPDGVLVTALHLLSLALDICEKHRNVHRNKYDGGVDMINAGEMSPTGVPCPEESKLPPVLEFATEPICMALHKNSGIGKHESLISLLVTLMRKHKKENSYADSRLNNIPSLVEGILKRFSQLNQACMNELKTLASDVFQMPECSSNNSMLNIMQPFAESQKAKSRERQAAILEKMRAEQFKFAATFKVDDKDDLDTPSFIEEKVLKNLSPICSLCHDTNSKSPLSFLVLLQKSKLSSLVSRRLATWEEIGNMDIDAREGPINIAIDASRRLNLLHDLHQNEFDTALNLSTNQLSRKRHIQSSHFSNADKNTLLSIQMMERNIYLSVVECIADFKFKLDVFAGGPIPKHSLGTKGLGDGNDAESRDTGNHMARLLKKVSKNHTSSQSPRHYGNASFISTIPALTGCDGIHISSCGHAVHQECHDRYLSSLKQRYLRRPGFEGHIVDPDMDELLCPVCRRLANCILPSSSNIFIFNDIWKQKISPDSISVTTACSTPSDVSRCSYLPHALSLLQGMCEVIMQGKYSLRNCLKAFPTKKNESVESALQPVLTKLFEIYFLHENSMLGPSKLNNSLMLWDTFKYSLISTEIAARGRENTCSEASNSCIQTLYKELHSSNGFILAELLQVAYTMQNLSHSHLILKFGAVQHFVSSICVGGIGEINTSNADWEEDSLVPILKQVEKGEAFPCIQFWKFAAGPVLAHDPFTSLMWILFSLPLPFMLSTGSFLSLVHLFYIVCVVQALITCQRTHQYDKASINDSGLYDICMTVGGSSVAGMYFASSHFDASSTLTDMIRKFTFPYLRRCALLSLLLKSLSSASFCDNHDELTLGTGNIASCSTDSLQADIGGANELENMFQICSLDIVFNNKLVQSLALKWCEHFLQVHEAYKPGNVLYSTTAVPFQLMQLPLLYQDLLERYIKRKCIDCGNIPEVPALCLLCGRLCSNRRLCCSASECKSHSTKCGAGIGIFLLVKETTILLQRSGRQTIWPSLYLDAFGEEDHDVYRGRPLYLSNERYMVLTNLVASHGLDHSSEVLRRTNTNFYSFE